MNLAKVATGLQAVVVLSIPTTASAQETLELVSAKRIWTAAKHNAFTDLTRFEGRWFCTFREAEGHVGGNGQIRVLTSSDGDNWTSTALLSEEGIDLRDPKFSVTPDRRLMLVMGGSLYEGMTLKERQPRVAFSSDGTNWTSPRRILDKGEWLWRVTWRNGRAYGVAYNASSSWMKSTNAPPDWTAGLFESDDGAVFRLVTKLPVPGRPNETTLRFLENGDCVALMRREGPGEDRAAWIGRSSPPYQDWQWHPAGMQIGGPNFMVLPGGALLAGGRLYGDKTTGNKTFIGHMTLEGVTPDLILPSGGDCSYPGLVWHGGLMWVSYYSSHEGKSAIYLAKVRVPKREP